MKWAIARFPFQEPILDTCAGWEEKLSLLIESPQLEEQMSWEKKERVLENNTHQVCAPRMFSILNRVAEGGQRFHHAV